MSVTFLDSFTVDLSAFGEKDYLIYWHYANDQDVQMLLAFQHTASLSALIGAIPGIGDTLSKLILIDFALDVTAGFYADHDNWGLRFTVDASIQLTDSAADNLKVDRGTGIGLESAIILKGDREGHVSVIFKLGSVELDLQFCSNDNHAMCVEDGYHCYAMFCRAPQPRGGACTHDIHCQSGHCMDEKGWLFCGDCSLDEHCPDGSFCEVVDLTRMGVCRTALPTGDPCDRDRACALGNCVGLFGGDTTVAGKCGGCSDDAPGTSPSACDESSFCDNVLNTDSQTCQPKRDGGAQCFQDKLCKSGHCNGFCRDCLDDAHCPDSQFCELGLNLGSLWMCVDKLGRGASCDRARACTSGDCGYDIIRNFGSPSCG